MLLTLGVLLGGMAQPGQPAPENQVKAVFLFNFAQFIEWPAVSFKSADAPFVIGILGDDPFGAYLDRIIRNEKINEHPLTVRRYRAVDEVKDCQILFLNLSDKGQVKDALDFLRGKNVLTVSDTDDFAKQGGIIRLFLRNQKVRLQINQTKALQEDLKISSKLLRVAQIYQGPDE